MTDAVSSDLTTRLGELARIMPAASPVVSVYLNTRWADEHQRERVRLFLKNELRLARAAGPGPALASDLDWIEAEGTRLVDQAEVPEADGVVLFACHALGLRERHTLRVSVGDAFVVDEVPHLRPLAAVLEGAPAALVVFVDTESARLIPLDPGGEEIRLEHEVPGHHRRGGWAQLAQSRYQRHIQVHRDQHLEAVAEALGRLTGSDPPRRVVLAGEGRLVGLLRQRLPAEATERVAATIPGARYEPADVLARRAAEALARADAEAATAAVDAVLTEAAKGGRAVAGLAATLEAVDRGAVHVLYLQRGFREAGRRCGGCGALQPEAAGPRCRRCGEATRPAELGEAAVDRVIATGGRVETVVAHEGLTRAGGLAARLRYPL
jgi:peptide subunit release factor 1 (eRF1)